MNCGPPPKVDSLRCRAHFVELRLVDDFHAKLARFFQFRAGVFTGENEIRLLANRIANRATKGFSLRRCLLKSQTKNFFQCSSEMIAIPLPDSRNSTARSIFRPKFVWIQSRLAKSPITR